jgi:peroxiredoxin
MLSLGEQMAVSEHGLEGRELQNEINRLQSLNVHANELFGHAGRRVLLFLFRGLACDRCLNMEISLLKKHRDLLERMGIDIIIVFSDIDQYQYQSFSNIFDITDIAVRDEATEFARFHDILSPIILLLSPARYVIAANISDYRDEGKSARFYEKVFRLIQGN